MSLYVLLGLGELARWVWLGVLVQQLRLYLLLPLWALTSVALRARVWWTLAPTIGLTLLSLLPTWPLFRPVTLTPSRGPTVRVATLGLSGERPDANDFARWLRAVEADLIVLTGVPPDPDQRLRGRAGYRAWTVRPERGASITLLSRLPVARSPVRGKDSAVRARFRVARCELAVTALRAPAVWDAALASERRELFERLRASRKRPARVWIGDLGGGPDAPGPHALMERARLSDSRRGFGRHATFPASLGAFGIPMDHILVGGWIAVRERTTGPRLQNVARRPAVADLQLTAPNCALTKTR